MRLFDIFRSSDSEDSEDSGGCGHHHFEEYEVKDEYRLTSPTYYYCEREGWTTMPGPTFEDAVDVYRLQEKTLSWCVHKDCAEHDCRWETVGYSFPDDIEDGFISKKELLGILRSRHQDT